MKYEPAITECLDIQNKNVFHSSMSVQSKAQFILTVGIKRAFLVIQELIKPAEESGSFTSVGWPCQGYLQMSWY